MKVKRSDMLGHRKLQVETRLKPGEWFPRRSGDKAALELTGADGSPVQITDTERAAKIAAILPAAEALGWRTRTVLPTSLTRHCWLPDAWSSPSSMPDRRGRRRGARWRARSRWPTSEADIIGYGGAAGGGKTDLAAGLTRHHKAMMLRRVTPTAGHHRPPRGADREPRRLQRAEQHLAHDAL